jgi:hypothetical protein
MAQLIDALPQFAAELARALNDAGHPALAESVCNVEIVERCPCNEPGCVSFYARPKSSCPAPGEGDRIIPAMRGVSCVMHHLNRIVWIEALGRPEDRAILDRQRDSPFAIPDRL